MILIDTSVWISHLRARIPKLERLLYAEQVLIHPHVIGELALGHLHQREVILNELQQLPRATTASDEEVLRFIDEGGLVASGVGYVDAHLLTATRLTLGATFWSGDKRLADVAARLGLAARDA